jgi:hypothetical protein
MRKFLAFAISAVSAVTLVLGATTLPARADLQDDVCAEMPNKLIASSSALSQANNSLNTANTTLTTRRTELNDAVVDWVNKFGDLIIAKDGGNAGQIAVAQAAFDAAAENVTSKATAWGNAKIAQWNAQHNQDDATVVHLMNTTLNTKLSCGAAVPS